MASDIPGVIHRYRRWPFKFCLWYVTWPVFGSPGGPWRTRRRNLRVQRRRHPRMGGTSWTKAVLVYMVKVELARAINNKFPILNDPPNRALLLRKGCIPTSLMTFWLTFVWCLLVQYPTGAGEGSREAGHWIFAGKLAENLSAERTGQDLLRKNDWNRITLTDETVQNVLCAASMSVPSKLLARATGYPREDIATRNWAPGSLLWSSCLT